MHSYVVAKLLLLLLFNGDPSEYLELRKSLAGKPEFLRLHIHITTYLSQKGPSASILLGHECIFRLAAAVCCFCAGLLSWSSFHVLRARTRHSSCLPFTQDKGATQLVFSPERAYGVLRWFKTQSKRNIVAMMHCVARNHRNSQRHLDRAHIRRPRHHHKLGIRHGKGAKPCAKPDL